MTTAKTDRFVDVALRAACVESESRIPALNSSRLTRIVGTHVGAAIRPLTADFCQKAMIKNTVSQSWRLGRAVVLAQKTGRIGEIGSILIDALGGPSTARMLFAGKITDVQRRVYKGHSVGEVVIAAMEQDEDVEGRSSEKYHGVMKSE
jgi:DUF917 family protein